MSVRRDGGVRARDYVQLFAPDGKPRGTLAVPGSMAPIAMAFDGGRVALLEPGSLWFMEVEGRVASRARLPESVVDAREVFFSPDGSELWLFTRPEAEMVRVAAPGR